MNGKGCFSRADQKLRGRAALIVNTTEDILLEMERQGLSKADLSKQLGKSRSFVSQILNGSRNVTLATLSDICVALGTTPRFLVDEGMVSPHLNLSSHLIGWQRGAAVTRGRDVFENLPVAANENKWSAMPSRIRDQPQLKLVANGN